MKVSIKFRDEQNPLFRAKLPLNILGFPFQSGIVAGESKEISLNLGTFFDSGPCLKLCYRPNDSFNPFGLVLKSGIGHFGSPISSSMTMSAEFNLIGNKNLSFFVHFRPRLGDFTVKKSQSSSIISSLLPKANSLVSDEEKTVEVVEPLPAVVNNGYFVENGLFPGKKFTVLPSESPAAGVVKGFFSGMEVSARSAVPLTNRVLINFRWGVRLSAAEESTKSNPMAAGLSIQKFPLLVMNKIGIEHVVLAGPSLDVRGEEEEEVSVWVRHQLEVIKSENGRLRNAIDDLRSEIVEERREMNKHLGGKIDRRSNNIRDTKSAEDLKNGGYGGKGTEGNVTEELEKALKIAAGA